MRRLMLIDENSDRERLAKQNPARVQHATGRTAIYLQWLKPAFDPAGVVTASGRLPEVLGTCRPN